MCAFSDSDEELIVQEYLRPCDDWLNEFDEVDLEYVRGLRSFRVGCRLLTWMYSGDLLCYNEGTHPQACMHWDNLSGDIKYRRWMDMIRMPQRVLDELYDVVCDQIPNTRPVVPGQRKYSKRSKLMVTLYYLAHVPTLRCMSRLFGIPHNSISMACLGPGLTALKHALCEDPDTKIVRRLQLTCARPCGNSGAGGTCLLLGL